MINNVAVSKKCDSRNNHFLYLCFVLRRDAPILALWTEFANFVVITKP